MGPDISAPIYSLTPLQFVDKPQSSLPIRDKLKLGELQRVLLLVEFVPDGDIGLGFSSLARISGRD